MLSVFMDGKVIQKYVDLLESRIYFLKAKQKKHICSGRNQILTVALLFFKTDSQK